MNEHGRVARARIASGKNKKKFIIVVLGVRRHTQVVLKINKVLVSNHAMEEGNTVLHLEV
jgi:hypothetical protein